MDIGKVLKTVSDYIDQKYIKKEDEIISNTNKNYCSALKMFLYHPNHLKYTHLKDISDDVILQYLLAIKGRSNRCTHHSAIKLMYRVHGFKNKMRFIPYPEKEEKLPIHVNKEEFLKMMNVCLNEKHRVIIALMFDAGLRVSEVINLKLSDIDESNWQLRIRQAKGRKDRLVKLTPIMLMIIKNYYNIFHPEIWLLNGQKPKGTTEIRKYTAKSCEEVVKQLTTKAGISKNFTPHKFRHGYAMNLLENGTDMSRIADQMGHKTTKTTEIYARINNNVIQSIESPLEQILRQSNTLFSNENTTNSLNIINANTNFSAKSSCA